MGSLTARGSRLRQWGARHVRLWVVVAALLALAYPLVVRRFYITLAEDVLIYAIFALSLDLLLGYTGLTSFGHAAFFGLGAYTLAFAATRLGLANLLVTAPLVLLCTGLAAAAIGALVLRTSGLYFLMVTLAVAQMLFSVALNWTAVTGGSDGLPGVPRPFIGLGALTYTFSSRAAFFYLLLAAFVSVWGLLRLITRSPFGLALRGIRDNEPRMRALGYNTFRYKLAAFVIAGMLAGLAGLLLAHSAGAASPETLYWTTSGQALIMLIVGGSGTLPGPVLGALTVRLLRNFISSATDRWETLMGVVFILFVLFARRGLAGLLLGQQEPPE